MQNHRFVLVMPSTSWDFNDDKMKEISLNTMTDNQSQHSVETNQDLNSGANNSNKDEKSVTPDADVLVCFISLN